jgi:hypothetical protein
MRESLPDHIAVVDRSRLRRRSDDATLQAMRAPDVFEVVIAILSAATVIGAIVAILYRVTRGNPDATRLASVKEALLREKAGRDIGER